MVEESLGSPSKMGRGFLISDQYIPQTPAGYRDGSFRSVGVSWLAYKVNIRIHTTIHFFAIMKRGPTMIDAARALYHTS